MLTALISAITGLLSGIVPDILREVKDSRAAARELQFLKLNHELAMERVKAEAGAKVEESYQQRISAEIQATKEQIVAIVTAQSQATGIAWIDGFNAVIRPLTALAFVSVFVAVVCGYSFGLTAQPGFGAAVAPLFTEGMMAVLGFLFGYRSVSGQKKAA
jgi:hypothetical protein